MAGSFCTRCGQPFPPGGRFCVRCGAPAAGPSPIPTAPVFGAAPGFGPPPPAAGPRGRSKLWVLFVVLGVGAVVVVALVVIPVHHSFSFALSGSGGAPPSQVESFPSGAPVSGTWSVEGGAAVNFTIVCGLGPTSFQTGSSGSFSFSATIAVCVFTATPTGGGFVTVDVSGSYIAPLL